MAGTCCPASRSQVCTWVRWWQVCSTRRQNVQIRSLKQGRRSVCLRRERIWVFWRRVLHTCHHRTQVQTWLRLAGHEPVPAIYGPSGDVKWGEADPTYSVEAARRGG